jgi:hypothetical protein
MSLRFQERKILLLEKFGHFLVNNVREGREYTEAEIQYYIDRKDKTGEDGLHFWEINGMPDSVQVRIYGDRRITEMKDEEYLHAVVMTKALKVDDDGFRDIVS